MSVARRETTDEHELYPVHEEDSVPEKPAHERQVRYLRDALEARLPECWVTGEICMYWEERAFNRYVAPDVLVVGHPAIEEPKDVYLAWTDGPALLVVEIGSKSTFREDEGPKVERYLLDLNVSEYIYYHPHRNARRRSLRMWRLEGEDVVDVPTPGDGRFHSQALDLDFGLDEDGFLRIYDPGGQVLLGAVEEHARAEQERARAEQERQRADQERHRAEQERQRVSALELELQRLREELSRRGNEPPAG
jgi:Uma2 family endonuclease